MILLRKLIAVLLILMFLLLGYSRMMSLSSENQRLKQNLEASAAQTKSLRTENGLLANQSQVLELRVRELSVLYPKVNDEIKNLKVKPKRAKQFSQVSLQGEKQIYTGLHDSIGKDSINYKVFKYHDDFYSVVGVASSDSQRVDIQYRDTLIQVIYKGERINPWLWVFSKRKLMQRATLKNPNALIGISQTIRIQKGRKFRSE